MDMEEKRFAVGVKMWVLLILQTNYCKFSSPVMLPVTISNSTGSYR
jgi:hypothetical protein